MKSNQLLKLLKPLFGLSDSGDYWHVTMKKHLVNDLKMHPLTRDLAYFIKCVYVKLGDLIGTYVDDTIVAGSDDFQKECQITERKFKAKEKELDSSPFSGIKIRKEDKGYTLNQ